MTAPSRTAAIGSTRVARIAGRRLASSAISVPTPRLTTIVRVEKTSPLLGSSMPVASRSAVRPTAIAEPQEEPDDRADDADGDRLEHDRPEHLTPRGAERAQGRELAHPLRDRDRERVGDHEAADEQRDAAEAEQEVLDDVQAVLRVRRCRRPPVRSRS